MRKRFFSVVSDIIRQNNNSFFILIDIGAYACRDLIKEYPERVKNIGIFEDGIVGIASGLACAGFTPIIYGISPFLINRANEQLKLDFAYQNFGGNFISTGASYDFSSLGFSHYCPEDISYLRNIPGFEICTPSTPSQLEKLLTTCWNNGAPTYYRMTDYCSEFDCEIEFGKANLVKTGHDLTIVAFAETIDKVIEASQGYDISIIYYSTIIPFDSEIIAQYASSKILIVSPFYVGFITDLIVKAKKDEYIMVKEIGVPHEILRNYGSKEEKDCYCGITVEGIKAEIEELLLK